MKAKPILVAASLVFFGVMILGGGGLFLPQSKGRGERGAPRLSVRESSRQPGEASAPGAMLSWEQAEAHAGQMVSVEGEVTAVEDAEGASLLLFAPEGRARFHAVIPAVARSGFPGEPRELYRSKRVRVTGRIREEAGVPQMVLEQAGQILVLDE